MEKTFKKMTTSFLSLLFMSMMLVSAGVYPVPFTNNNEANVAVVYGVSAAATDSTAADSLVNSLANGIVTEEELERIFSAGITEDEAELGSKISKTFTDNKIPSLFDGKIDWDDGEDTDSYNVHEEIVVGDMDLLTTLDNNDFDGVVLTNNKGLEYKLIFEENIFTDDRNLDNDSAEPLEVSILGQEYVINEVEDNSITITNAEKLFLAEGDTTTVDGVSLTIEDIYDESIIINGVVIDEGKKETVNGVEVKVEEVYFTSKDNSVSKVEIYAGGDISKEYSDGDAFIGEDDDDPEWVWSISNPGYDDGYIGVRYDLRQTDEEDDVVYAGEEYIFPNGFATVSFDSLTEVDYSEYEVYFDEVELYTEYDNDKGYVSNTDDVDVEVVVINGAEDDSFELFDIHGELVETNTLYLYKVDEVVRVYYRDVSDDFDGKPMFYKEISLDFPELQDMLNSKKETLAEALSNVTAAEADVTAAEEKVSTISNSFEDTNYNVSDEDCYRSDVNEDELINQLDIDFIENKIGATDCGTNNNWCELADVNGDSIVSQSDMDIANNYINILDINRDGAINQADVTAAEADVTAAKADVTAVEEIVTAAEADVTAAEELVDSYSLVIATLVSDDTEMAVSISEDGKTLSIVENDNITNINIALGDDFAHLGSMPEEAEKVDVIVNGTDIGTKENDVMDNYGIIIESPESNADDDKVVFRVPSERVYAQISVLGSTENTVVNTTAVKPTATELGITKITDGSITAASGKNIIVVGGSCINTVAANLLGGKACGEEFTAKTGVSVGQVLIETFDRGDGSLATVVAGYNAADTVRGVNYLLNNDIVIAAGEKMIV